MMSNIPRTPCFVAEVSSNHHRDLGRCLAFVDRAAEIGCDAVKFQLFRLEELFAPEVLHARPEVRERKSWELPVAFLPPLAERCRERGILFACTPFYLEAVPQLLPFVDFYKVASYELMWDDLLRACAVTGKPLVLSTGMATMQEIRHAVGVVVSSFRSIGVSARPGCDCTVQRPLKNSGTPATRNSPTPCTLPALTLLHCVSGYPTPLGDCNLAAIQTLREAFGAGDCRPQTAGQSSSSTPRDAHTPPRFSIGWSDHSVNPGVVLRAVRHWGASLIEFHLDLDGQGDEYKTGHCWLPDQIAPVIAEVRSQKSEARDRASDLGLPVSDLELAIDGNGIKAPVPSELPDREWRADPADGLRPMRSMRACL